MRLLPITYITYICALCCMTATASQASDIEVCKEPKAAPAAAIEACSRLISLRPLSPFSQKLFAAFYTNRCAAKYWAGEIDAAITDCNEALSINADYAGAYHYLGVILIKREQFIAAIKQFTAAIDRAHLLGSYVNRGFCYERLSHNAEAISDYGVALRLTATNALEQEAQELARIRLASLSNERPAGQPLSLLPPGQGPLGSVLQPAPVPSATAPSSPVASQAPAPWPGDRDTSPIQPKPVTTVPVLPPRMTEAIPLQLNDGTYSVLVTINGKLTVPFTLDSGATDTAIPAEILLTLLHTGTISEADMLDKKNYRLANGSTVSTDTVRLHSLQIGSKIITDVIASVSAPNTDLLLGGSFLSKLRHWSVDNQAHQLIIE
jgi:clan AA aspartic protease (TIGR02281 family)